MIERLADILVVSDMDNTLLTAKSGIPACNRAAIELFCSLGGRFTVATGRPPASVQAAMGTQKLSAPAVCCGGSILYDFEQGRAVYRRIMETNGAKQAIRDVMEQFPTVGVEVLTGSGEIRLLRANRYTQAHLADEKLGCILQPLDTLPDDWLKVVFAGESALLEQIEAFAGQKSYPGVYFLRTNTIYYEIMPQGVNKASGLERLCARLALPMENVIFIGDYYNDLDLMRLAGHSVAVANAPLDVQAQADEVTLSRCADGGVGEYLYRLVKRYV